MFLVSVDEHLPVFTVHMLLSSSRDYSVVLCSLRDDAQVVVHVEVAA